jgi:hypothetical protein
MHQRTKDVAGKDAEHDGGGKGHAGEDPRVRRAVAEAAEDDFVDPEGEIGIGFEGAGSVAGEGDVGEQQPVANQQQRGDDNLANDSDI